MRASSFILFFFVTSCAFFQKIKDNNPDYSLNNIKRNFQIKDLSGQFRLSLSQGLNQSKNTFFTKYRMKTFDVDSKIIEQSVVISTPGESKGINLFRPLESEYVVWFDQKKYSSRIKYDKNRKAMFVDLKSPEEQWNGKKIYPFPKTKSVVCYLSQIIPCAGITGFIEKAISKGVGKMKVLIIFEGFPFFHEQYPGLPNTLFSEGSFNYIGKNSNGKFQFELDFLGQVILYQINAKFELVKKFWTAQGLSMEESN